MKLLGTLRIGETMTERLAGWPPRDRNLRQHLPYGKWTCANGREVLFNRAYGPIWQRVPLAAGGWLVKVADAQERVHFAKQEWFFDSTDRRAPWNNRKALRRCMEVLKEFGATFDGISQYVEVQRFIDQEKR